ncbi:AAA family ATPase [Idiomarina sp.]|uniref:AAA family ATPase n=1 Tax=Idiomarina sp. TaxID=1874361 RepID=UPI001D465E9D|nr:AAA family ATPase [Idiomarina sp.]MCJ8317058.1 AAA family ATPase [Idiomarina sp.]NQZ16673.1 AAA family ATPase [Idiomarina sp.]
MQALATTQHIVAAPVKNKPSQQQAIDQLHQQCQQSVSLIMLHGAEGSGKTTVAELFLEQASDYAEVAFISANERSTNDRLRAQILNQLFGTISISDESLSRQIQRQRPLNHAIIVIDNGEYLSESFLAECISTVSQLSAIGQRTSIIVAGSSRWAQQQRPAPHLRVQGPAMVEVQPFSHEEQIRFVQALLPEKQRSFWNLERVQQFLNSINGYPGEIQQRLQLTLTTQAARYRDSSTTEQEQSASASASESDTEKAPSKMKLWPLILIAALISTAVAGYLNKDQLLPLWEQFNSSAASTTQEEALPETTDAASVQATEGESEPAQAEEPQTTELPTFEPINERSLELVPEELASSYRASLGTLNNKAAAEITEGDISVGFIKEQQPKEAEPVGTVVAESGESNEAPAETAANQPAQAEPATTQTAQTQELPFNTEWALSQPTDSYTLQISIISDTQLLSDFRQDYGLIDNTQVYQRDDNRYVIIFGSYNSIEQARNAAGKLPQAVQQMEPWAKSFASVHADIQGR